jgi:hypothetical protein
MFLMFVWFLFQNQKEDLQSKFELQIPRIKKFQMARFQVGIVLKMGIGIFVFAEFQLGMIMMILFYKFLSVLSPSIIRLAAAARGQNCGRTEHRPVVMTMRDV